jgi:hypothetical protein
MKLGFGTYALMVTVVLYGVLLGGVVYSHIVFFPPYLSHLPDSASITNGPYALHDENFWTVIHPLLLLSLVVSIVINWRSPFRRSMLAITFAVYALVLVISFWWFIPQLIDFRDSASSAVSTAEWQHRGEHWQHMSWVRGGTLFVFSIPLLLALARPRNETR